MESRLARGPHLKMAKAVDPAEHKANSATVDLQGCSPILANPEPEVMATGARRPRIARACLAFVVLSVIGLLVAEIMTTRYAEYPVVKGVTIKPGTPGVEIVISAMFPAPTSLFLSHKVEIDQIDGVATFTGTEVTVNHFGPTTLTGDLQDISFYIGPRLNGALFSYSARHAACKAHCMPDCRDRATCVSQTPN